MNASTDLIGALVGAVLTILILSYALGDNPLYRLALHILVGATVGYGVAIATVTVLFQIVLPALQGSPAERYSMVIPFVLGVLLMMKGFPRWAAVGNLSTAFMIGVAAAVALAGALLGTIIPQATASGSIGEWVQAGAAGLFNGLLVTGGAICALLAFRFAAPKRSLLSGLWNALVAPVGRAFLLAAFGAAFAAALTASLSVLTGRIDAILSALRALMGG